MAGRPGKRTLADSSLDDGDIDDPLGSAGDAGHQPPSAKRLRLSQDTGGVGADVAYDDPFASPTDRDAAVSRAVLLMSDNPGLSSLGPAVPTAAGSGRPAQHAASASKPSITTLSSAGLTLPSRSQRALPPTSSKDERPVANPSKVNPSAPSSDDLMVAEAGLLLDSIAPPAVGRLPLSAASDGARLASAQQVSARARFSTERYTGEDREALDEVQVSTALVPVISSNVLQVSYSLNMCYLYGSSVSWTFLPTVSPRWRVGNHKHNVTQSDRSLSPSTAPQCPASAVHSIKRRICMHHLRPRAQTAHSVSGADWLIPNDRHRQFGGSCGEGKAAGSCERARSCMYVDGRCCCKLRHGPGLGWCGGGVSCF